MSWVKYIADLQCQINLIENIKATSKYDDETLEKEIQEKRKLIEECKFNLERLSAESIERRLYLKLINGLKPTKAVEEVAKENYLQNIKPNSLSSIWSYYKKMKKSLKL